MERFLITQSLLSAWAYCFDCFEGFEDDAYADFLRTLRREPGEQTEAMLNGIAFERLCYSIANGAFKPTWVLDDPKHPAVEPNSGEAMGHYEYPKYYAGAAKVAEIIKGAPIQVKASREIEVGGIRFLVFGILDALKAGTIYDVKFMNKSMGSADVYGKYLDSAQHPAYFHIVPEATDFKYLLSDGEDLYIEHYRREDTRPIGDFIAEFIESLRGWNLLDTYREKWLAL